LGFSVEEKHDNLVHGKPREEKELNYIEAESVHWGTTMASKVIGDLHLRKFITGMHGEEGKC
jgi:hypothetical protein